ncbi:MAG: NUDIX domain-containing protein [Candidatus Saccharibacteria bacterium]|nr:NUDIX domain-containing protein [Candidatus Saccharibacteria bacterium]
MGNQQALIDIVDENGNPTGYAKTKREIHEQGFWHNAAHVWIYNSHCEILMQLRSKDKDSYPGLWDISVAGHTESGETPIQSAVREMKEEIGLNPEYGKLEPEGIYIISQPIEGTLWQDNEIGNVFFYKFNGSVDDLSMPDGEVEKLEFVPIDRFEKEVNDVELRKKYVPYQPLSEYYSWVISRIAVLCKK